MRRSPSTLADIKPRTKLSRQLAHDLREVLSYLAGDRVAKRIWTGVLSEEDRRQLGESYSPQRLIQVYALAHSRSFERAVVDLAMEASVIGIGQHRRLLRQIGELVEDQDDLPRPHWDRQTGELHYRGELIRNVSSPGTDIRLILDAFQDAKWGPRMDNPLPGGPQSKKLRDALDSLKERLKGITFFADGTATGILWQRATRKVAPALTGASRRK